MTAFPTRFDKLENLRYLNLSEAGFTGQIPIEISRLTRLVTLDLSIDTLFRTPLKLEKPNLKTLVQNLTKLRILYLYGVNISAMGNEWCQALSPLTELQVLSMSDLIRLDRNNLSGLIPQFFTKFPNLTCLSLSSVNFSGPIPSFSSSINLRDLILALNQLNGTIHSTDWSGLSKLEIIGLGNNKLSGTIPPTLFGIPSLRTLSLSHNQFNGSIGDFHGKASSLINTLDLGNNMLQGQFPMFVFELHGLTSLNLSSNNFSGLIPVSAFQNLRNLSALGLSYNRWSIDATTINISSLSLPTLAELDLASCNLTEFPGFLKNRINLARLNLSQNFLVGFERPLKNITSSVEILDLHGNQLQGEIPILSNAAYLDYSNNNFNSVLPAQIGDSLQYAFFFSLSNNNIQGSIPESICNSKYLEVLDLSNNSLSGPIPQCLFQMNRSLGVLNLRRNNLSGIISDTSSKSCQLQTLNLNQNRLEGKVPNSLVNCKMVKLLDIGNNHINDSFPSHLKNIATGWQMLQILNLASNNFSGKLHLTCLRTWDAMQPNPDKNQSELQHLQCEDLRSGVKYQDAITITIKGLVLELVKIPTVFTYIDISCNNFEGPIPEVIGKFNALYSLNVSHNAFTGPIPSSFGNLLELESLDLSSNSLRGEIPLQLANLNFLSCPNVSNNKLVGPIPTITQLQTFSEASFENNAELCGPPLKTKCGLSPAKEDSPSDSETGSIIHWNHLSIEIGFLFPLKLNTLYSTIIQNLYKIKSTTH
ncbi:hypothetical protein E1A91_D01G264000v1 [Gossypium mustelinum]|uniref:Leucine-rich repeat-containing N-terminal plant-type domain-containing protein n=1 Tax=Gossypium mustelinum TaxID=34275 RepID=A0A5D2WB59_GOSMU|nr:hypothetical protein E1A91_D01G264000v1 [Gossypium mustelinum]